MRKSIVKTFSTVLIITIFSKVLGLLRDIVFANYYGTGYMATAFFASIRIPTQLLDLILSSALISTFIPVFNEIMQKESKDKANKFASNYVNIVTLISTLISVIGIIFAPQVVKMLAGGFDEVTYNLTVELIRITFPMIIFTAIAFSFVGFLQSYGNFNVPAMISGISNLVFILFLIFFKDKFGIHGIAIFMLIAWILQVLIQLPYAKKEGFKFEKILNLKDENIRKIVRLAIPIVISTAVLPISNLVCTRLASGMGNSAVAALEYSYKLYIVISGVFTYAIGNIIFPELSRHSVNNDKEKYVEVINKSIRMMTYILIPLTIGIMIFRTDIVSLLYERGEFNEASTAYTSGALLYYSIGIIGFGIVEIMNKAFYAKQDTKTPLKISLIIIIINIVLSILLGKIFNFKGLALAAALTAIINAIILTIFLNISNKQILSKNLLLFFIKIVISVCIMAALVYYTNILLKGIFVYTNLYKIIRILVGGILGIVIYYTSTLIMKVEESILPIEFLKEKYNKETKNNMS